MKLEAIERLEAANMALPDKPLRVKRKFWIQRADFSSESFDPVELKIAKAIVAGYDWASELALYETQLEECDDHWEDCCSPGIGFQTEDEKHLLHLCPLAEDHVQCFYLQFDTIGQSESAHWLLDHLQLEQINQLLQLFFAEDYASLIAYMEKG